MRFICNWSLISFKHKIEFTNCSIFSFFTSANRAVNMCINEIFHFFVCHCVNRFSRINIWIGSNKIFNHFICTVTSLTFKTVNHRIRKVICVTRSLPCCMMLENCGIKSNNIIMKLRHIMPPFILNVSFKFNT